MFEYQNKYLFELFFTDEGNFKGKITFFTKEKANKTRGRYEKVFQVFDYFLYMLKSFLL